MVTETEPLVLGGYAVLQKQPKIVASVHLLSTYAEATG